VSWLQDMLDPAGPQAARIAGLWWVALGIATVVYALVIAALAHAVLRRRRGESLTGEERRAHDRTLTTWIAGATGLTVLTLLAYLVMDLGTGRALAAAATGDTLGIIVTGRQWWWEIEYEHPDPSRRVRTANELHIPVGRPVLIKTRSADVIHSFWVPNLHGKRDNIPGYTRPLWIQADRPGIYRGECAEFCGHQHAKMAMQVIAMPQEEFEQWYAGQLQPSQVPSDSIAQAGLQVFLNKPCIVCHSIRGTPARGETAPDLTHLASRRTIAAGTLPNTRGHLGGWVVDPQQIKPGVKMPPSALSPSELEALLTYLRSLR
jgi:cytochrome c oxidase subunit 2